MDLQLWEISGVHQVDQDQAVVDLTWGTLDLGLVEVDLVMGSGCPVVAGLERQEEVLGVDLPQWDHLEAVDLVVGEELVDLGRTLHGMVITLTVQAAVAAEVV